MTTGTNGNDNLSNDPNILNETVDALDGDDIITIVTPNNLGNPGPTVTVNGGIGSDRLVVNTAGAFQTLSGTGNEGSLLVRFGPAQFYSVAWSAIERLELTGSLFGDGAFVTGDSIDVLRFGSSTARAAIQTGAGADDIALTGTYIAVTISAGTGNDLVDLRGLTGVIETIGVQGGDGNDILFASQLVDTLAGGNNNDALVFGSFLTAADGADGGAGTDTVVVQGNYPALVLGAGLVNNEVLLVASGGDTRFGDIAGNSYDYNITTVDANVGAGAILTVSANLLAAGEDLVFNGAAETNGAFRILTGAGNDTLSGGNGNDAFVFGAFLTAADGANGGAGADTVVIQGNYPALTLGAGLVNNEVLLVASGSDTRFGDTAGNSYDYNITTVDANVAAGALLTVSATLLAAGEDLVLNGAAETNGAFRVFAGAGNDTLTGGAGNDGFFFGADDNFTGADTVNGGGGTDSIALRGNYPDLGSLTLQDSTFTNVEVLVLLSGLTNEFGGPIVPGGFDYNLTLADGNIAAGQRLEVNAINLGPTESIRINAGNETDGSVRILSGAGDDTLIGTSGADVFYGGLGADVMTAVAIGDADIYLYRSTAESTATSTDTINFLAGDRIDLSFIDADGPGASNAFTFIGASAFSNVAGQLRVGQLGNVWMVEGDTNGDGIADLVITVNSTDPINAGVFIL